jgi:hypothetical protein
MATYTPAMSHPEINLMPSSPDLRQVHISPTTKELNSSSFVVCLRGSGLAKDSKCVWCTWCGMCTVCLVCILCVYAVCCTLYAVCVRDVRYECVVCVCCVGCLVCMW